MTELPQINSIVSKLSELQDKIDHAENQLKSWKAEQKEIMNKILALPEVKMNYEN